MNNSKLAKQTLVDFAQYLLRPIAVIPEIVRGKIEICILAILAILPFWSVHCKILVKKYSPNSFSEGYHQKNNDLFNVYPLHPDISLRVTKFLGKSKSEKATSED